MGFNSDFLWGTASAAYQVEGAYDEDGKGMGIWDALSNGHVAHGENGNVACDHYHRYKEDVALMKKMGIKAYRFSVSWPRVMPKEGVINEKGLQFYKNLVKELADAGIEPMCTLFHWNLPMWLHEKGGWHSEEIGDAFAEYVKAVVGALSDRVTYWMTFNEPACFVGLGYVTGMHAPFEKGMDKPEDLKKELPNLVKNVLMAHGKAVRAIRENAKGKPQVGMAINFNLIIPEEMTQEEIERAKEETFSEENSVFGVETWAGPAFNGTVPEFLKEALTPERMEIIHQPLDFFGFNCYNSNNYADGPHRSKRAYPGMPKTGMGWEITPDALYWAAKFLHERYQKPMLITENGMANLDFVMSDGKIHDPQRIEYMKGYIHGLKKAVDEGVPVIGYMYWSIMDNFEWAEGYDRRFGLIYVDYRTQERTLKDSAYWYTDVIAHNGEDL